MRYEDNPIYCQGCCLEIEEDGISWTVGDSGKGDFVRFHIGCGVCNKTEYVTVWGSFDCYDDMLKALRETFDMMA